MAAHLIFGPVQNRWLVRPVAQRQRQRQRQPGHQVPMVQLTPNGVHSQSCNSALMATTNSNGQRRAGRTVAGNYVGRSVRENAYAFSKKFSRIYRSVRTVESFRTFTHKLWHQSRQCLGL